MFKKIKSILISGLLVCLCLASGIAAVKMIIKSSTVETSYTVDSIDKLSDDSPTIIIGSASKSNKTVTYEDVNFVLTKITINDVIKDINKELDPGRTITLLQTKCDEDPTIDSNGQTLLFLEKYEGPITSETAYVCKGLYQGQYKIKNNKIAISDSIKNNNPTLSEDVNAKGDIITLMKEKFKNKQ